MAYQLIGKNGSFMVPIRTTGLALGQVVSYGDMANPRQKAVITSTVGSHYGQPCIFVDTYSKSEVSITAIEGLGGWEYTKDEPWSISQIRDLEAKAAQAIIDRAQAREDKAREFKAEVAKLITDNPHLTAGQGHIIGAKNIRTELKRAFPTTKFSVTGRSYSGGCSIDVRWTDGPTTKQIEAITGKYQYGDFDGMTDSYNYRRGAWTEAFGSARHVMESRNYSLDLARRAIAELVDHYGDYNTPTAEDYQSGKAYNATPINGADLYHDSWQSLITRKCSEIDCTAAVMDAPTAAPVGNNEAERKKAGR